MNAYLGSHSLRKRRAMEAAARLNAVPCEGNIYEGGRVPRRNTQPHIPIFLSMHIGFRAKQAHVGEHCSPNYRSGRRNEIVEEKRIQYIASVEPTELAEPI